LDVRYRAPVQLVQHLSRLGTLDLIAVESASDRDVAGNGSLIPGESHLIPARLCMVLHPVVNGGPADENQFVLVEIKEDGVANYIAIVTAPDELLGFVDGIIRKTVDARG